MSKNGSNLSCFQYPLVLTTSSIFFLLYKLIVFISAQSPSSYYVPVEHITFGCGSSNDTKGLDGRTWTADKDFLQAEDNNSASSTSTSLQVLNMVDDAPYRYARLSRSPFSYSIPVSSGPKFVRLYFYPVSYAGGFNAASAFFSVEANRFTLVSNYSTALNAQVPGEAFFKEFCFVVRQQEQRVKLTFIPSTSMPDAYAFVNAIEIISMPAYLYYNKDDDLPENEVVSLDPQIDRRSIDSTTAMELMYRLNVGGSFISPRYDTGMFRTWENDEAYLTIAILSTLPVNQNLQPRFLKTENYTAPVDVYRTARSMGNNKTTNENYYLTWEFKVDSSFTYFIRLHFCEFEPEIEVEGDRVFKIYMDNMIAEGHADVIYWSGGNGIPIVRDYTRTEGAYRKEKIQNLSVALGTVSESQTSYSNAILNGIEVFKLSNFYNLSGKNPDPPSPPLPNVYIAPATSSNNGRTVAIAVGTTFTSFVILVVLFFLILRRGVRGKVSLSGSRASYPTNSSCNHDSAQPSELCHRFSLAEIKAATNNFDEVLIVGDGGFGKVYKGFINIGTTVVAIKRLNPESAQGVNEFKNEIEMLSQLSHLHLVSLIGYCHEEEEMILVYKYMARGTLRDHLYKTDNPPLSWKQRLEICIGAARGLLYLHLGAKRTIIHRDVKTTNILLDEKWVAKVSDFGLSKSLPINMENAHISTVVKGSIGYVDPEYFRFRQLTKESDIYSFGVVLCEVLCARPPVMHRPPQESPSLEEVSLAECVRRSYKDGTINNVVDPYLRGKIEPKCLKKFVEIAVSCMLVNGLNRPSISDVVWGLEFALQLQQDSEELKLMGGVQADDVEFEDLVSLLANSSTIDYYEAMTNNSSDSKVTGASITSSSEGQSFFSKSSLSSIRSC